jgi:hypothetical protein
MRLVQAHTASSEGPIWGNLKSTTMWYVTHNFEENLFNFEENLLRESLKSLEASRQECNAVACAGYRRPVITRRLLTPCSINPADSSQLGVYDLPLFPSTIYISQVATGGIHVATSGIQ